MLTHEIMGWVALWVMWGNTALIVLAGIQPSVALLRRASLLAKARSGKVVDAPDGVLASFVVQQLGRATSGKRAIAWHDKSYGQEVSGGVVRLDDGREIRIAAGADLQVWTSADLVNSASRCPSEASFEQHFEPAQKFRGAPRQVSVPVARGQRVFVLSTDEQPTLIATMNPATWCRRRGLFGLLVVQPLVIGAASVATWLALTPPVFEGTLSKLGGLLGLIYFLLVLAVGTKLRDFLRTPDQRIVRGEWSAGGHRRAALTASASAQA